MSEDLPEPPEVPVEVILKESERMGIQIYREKELRRKQEQAVPEPTPLENQEKEQTTEGKSND